MGTVLPMHTGTVLFDKGQQGEVQAVCMWGGGIEMTQRLGQSGESGWGGAQRHSEALERELPSAG